ncbi:unnamed protein product [Arctia plantaginis]|uniref:Uncharacterized protein n=1 Tax=Arctia plantaginis TaxID=874455 RepID=A0A8S1BLU1_ARCPL|nr:unnamed protein product [Arctia plantaginis]
MSAQHTASNSLTGSQPNLSEFEEDETVNRVAIRKRKNPYDSEYFDSRYEVYRCDRDPTASGCSRGGGVAVAVRRELCAFERRAWCVPAPASLAAELWLSVPLRGPARHSAAAAPCDSVYLYIVCTYIPHGPQHAAQIESFYDRNYDHKGFEPEHNIMAWRRSYVCIRRMHTTGIDGGGF